ncbi:MAG TPA: hypothetical protein VJ716_04020 [Gaiellaceae bacterium]|nr:hypothetical protein [Gaiellaceae bacterium]
MLALGAATASGDTTGVGAHPIQFSTLHQGHGHPVAGRVFKGLAATNNTGLASNPEPFNAVRCAAEIGGKRLPAHKTISGSATSGHAQVVVCAWHIPANAGGKKLRLWNNNGSSLTWAHRAYARAGDYTVGSEQFVWRVLKP